MSEAAARKLPESSPLDEVKRAALRLAEQSEMTKKAREENTAVALTILLEHRKTLGAT